MSVPQVLREEEIPCILGIRLISRSTIHCVIIWRSVWFFRTVDLDNFLPERLEKETDNPYMAALATLVLSTESLCQRNHSLPLPAGGDYSVQLVSTER
ncbi:hypothetical protein CCP3SC15_1060009 [Gammaproteobacteria bacterium]